MNSADVLTSSYDSDFFDYISIGSMRSAAVVAPLVLQHCRSASLVDIGCGRGAWLVEWKRAGISDFLGIDGAYVDQDRLLISRARFAAQDLTRPFDLGRRFDLVTSLEVGEHIRPEATEVFVDNLCTHADAILFSAAVPGQGGTFHVNERGYGFWRDCFAARGYRLFDFLRPLLISHREVEPWYRYNTLFFASDEALERLSPEALGSEVERSSPVADYAPVTWWLRNALIKRLPLAALDRLVELKHRFVRWRHE
jgi:hypothetical protein